MTTHDFETGMYFDRATAEETVELLHDLGYAYRDISIMMIDREKARAFADDADREAAKCAATGGEIGNGLCAIIASLMATGRAAPIVSTSGMTAPLVAGPLAVALAGFAAYEEGLNRGGLLLGVNPRHEHLDRVREIFAPSRKSSRSASPYSKDRRN